MSMHFQQWLSEPYPLQQDTMVYGCGKTPIQSGTVVVKCKFWDRIPNQDGLDEGDWFEKPEFDFSKRIIPEQKIVWIRDILIGSVNYQNPGDEGLKDPGDVFFHRCNRGLAKNKILIAKATIKGANANATH